MTPTLTDRQSEVLRLIALGLTDEGIAEHLDLGVTTVRSHVKKIRKALGATNRAHAALLGVQHRILYFAGDDICVH